MKRSTGRILTAHTGSLPRPMDLAAMQEALDSGGTLDRETLETRVRTAVAEVVRNQVECGVDLVSDGEQGKVGYSTYVRHRLTGFDGEGPVSIRSDFPGGEPSSKLNLGQVYCWHCAATATRR